MKHLKRARSSARKTRGGWVPLDLSAQLLLLVALVPLFGLAGLAGDDLAAVGERASTQVEELVDAGQDLAERILDPDTLYHAFVGEPVTPTRERYAPLDSTR